jgi:hypothetical protein
MEADGVDGGRKRLSAIVDAVIDTTADDIVLEREGKPTDAPFEPLLERTLRPRGLSDSSIRSTFVSHANEGPGRIVHPGVAGGTVGRIPGYGVLNAISRRWYNWGAGEVSPVDLGPDSAERQEDVTETEVDELTGKLSNEDIRREAVPPTPPLPPAPVLAQNKITRSPARPIPQRGDSRNPALSTFSPSKGPTPTSPTTVSSQTGLFGMLASSIVGHGESMMASVEGGDGEEMGASLRVGRMVGRTASRAGRKWT